MISFSEIKYQIQLWLFVETKDQRVIPFKLNQIQESFITKIVAFVKKFPNKPLRILILKGRQFGFSTLILSIFFIKCLIVKNTRAVVISHEKEATLKLFRRVKFFADTLALPPTLEKQSEHEYSFPRTNSYFYIGTAGSRAFGRGDNLTDVHCSEVPFWPKAANIMNGLIQAVGEKGLIIIESTANGVGDYFHRLWKKSYKNPNAAWLALFFKWTKFSEYERDPGPNFKRTPQEEHLCSLHPELNDRKLAWRRWKISEIETDEGKTPEQIFQQEYPFTPHEAFISSGRPVFSQTALENYQPKKPIDIEDGFTIWKKPSGYSIMSIDSSEGLENHDRSVIDIYDEHLEQVAQWAGWCDPDELAEKAIIWGTRYNSFIINEVNNMGIAVNLILRKRYPKNKQYKREVFDEVSKKKIYKTGWRTSPVTKATLVGALTKAIRNNEILFNCPETIDECMSFIRNGQGGFEADEGCNDDRVITSGLALQAFLDHPPKISNITPEAQEKSDLEKINKKWRKDKIKKFKQKNKKKLYG